jgi:hypothetical protein
VFVLGIFTYTRLAQNSVEDIFYGRAINRIRHYYLELAGDRARHFMLGGNDDPLGVVRNMAVQPSRWQLHFTNAMAIGVVNAVVGGSVLALAIGVAAGASIGISVPLPASAATKKETCRASRGSPSSHGGEHVASCQGLATLALIPHEP